MDTGGAYLLIPFCSWVGIAVVVVVAMETVVVVGGVVAGGVVYVVWGRGRGRGRCSGRRAGENVFKLCCYGWIFMLL